MAFTNRVFYTLGQALRGVGFPLHEERDPRVQAMKKTIQGLGSIQFHVEVFQDGNWTAESTNVPGIITGGRKADEMNATIKDAVFTYFEIPPLFCHDALMHGSTEPIQLERRVYA